MLGPVEGHVKETVDLAATFLPVPWCWGTRNGLPEKGLDRSVRISKTANCSESRLERPTTHSGLRHPARQLECCSLSTNIVGVMWSIPSNNRFSWVTEMGIFRCHSGDNRLGYHAGPETNERRYEMWRSCLSHLLHISHDCHQCRRDKGPCTHLFVRWSFLSPSSLRRGTGRDWHPRRSGEGKLLYLKLHSHLQNCLCLKMMGGDGSHWNVSLIVRGKVKLQALVYDMLPSFGGRCRKAMLGTWGKVIRQCP